jgi:hypothetical protein
VQLFPKSKQELRQPEQKREHRTSERFILLNHAEETLGPFAEGKVSSVNVWV